MTTAKTCQKQTIGEQLNCRVRNVLNISCICYLK